MIFKTSLSILGQESLYSNSKYLLLFGKQTEYKIKSLSIHNF